jgi:phenylacetate-coenzyme A ligase PaaK-like adenylate-forming protein
MLLLDEVKASENYELVITNFHGGAMTRYRVGDMIKITSMRDEKLGIKLPQMTFERRVDDILDFYAVRFTEKTIWQAIESTGIAYEDWVAYKIPGEPILRILIELKRDTSTAVEEIARAIYKQLMRSKEEKADLLDEGFIKSLNFNVEVTKLPRGSFNTYLKQRQAEGADLSHLKPPHVNPSERVLSILTSELEETTSVVKTSNRVEEKPSTEKAPVP